MATIFEFDLRGTCFMIGPSLSCWTFHWTPKPSRSWCRLDLEVRGISVEPLRSYFEQLPVAGGKLLLNVAISNHDGFEDLYFVRPQLVEACAKLGFVTFV